MPIYEYLCKDCEQIVEEWQKDFSDRMATCPVCGGDAQRIISNTSFVLKGTGWYVTDYQGGRANGANGKNGAASSTDAAGSGAEASASATDSSGSSGANGAAKTPEAPKAATPCPSGCACSSSS